MGPPQFIGELMKNLLMTIVALFVAAYASADNVSEIQIINGTPNGDYYLTGKVHGKLGWSAWALVSESWAETYAGPTFAPAKWIEVGIAAGIETPGARFEECLWLGKGRFSVLAVAEQGASGPWHRIIAKMDVGHGFTVGYHDQAVVGRGLHAAFTRGKVTLRTALLVKGGKVGAILAIAVGS